MDQLLEARKTNERAKRQRRYESALTTVLEDRVHLPLYMLKSSFGVQTSVHDFVSHTMPTINPRLVGTGTCVSLD